MNKVKKVNKSVMVTKTKLLQVSETASVEAGS